MMGDNRDNSDDSRYWGFVPDDHIRGQGVLHLVQLGRHFEPGVQADRQRDPMSASGATAMTTIGKRRTQRGLSMIGFLFVAAVVLVVAMIAFRMIPSYIEYYTIQKALEGALADSNDLSTATIRRAMERRLARRLHRRGRRARTSRSRGNGNEITASVGWEKRLPLVGNVSLLLDFYATGVAVTQPADRMSAHAERATGLHVSAARPAPAGADAPQLRHAAQRAPRVRRRRRAQLRRSARRSTSAFPRSPRATCRACARRSSTRTRWRASRGGWGSAARSGLGEGELKSGGAERPSILADALEAAVRRGVPRRRVRGRARRRSCACYRRRPRRGRSRDAGQGPEDAAAGVAAGAADAGAGVRA